MHFGDDAYYVHLRRDRAAVAKSFSKRYNRGIMGAYWGEGIIMGLHEPTDPLEVCGDYYDTVNANISFFLENKSKKMNFYLEDWKQLFPLFCQEIGAQGDISACLSEFEVKHNASPSRP